MSWFLVTSSVWASPKSDPSAVKTTEVKVVAGDSLSRIAKRFSVSIEEIRAWNTDVVGDNDMIRVGDTLLIKLLTKEQRTAAEKKRAGGQGASSGSGDDVWYTYISVRRGHTLGKIATRMGVTVAELKRWNGLGKSKLIRAGDVLKIEKRGPREPARSTGKPTSGGLVNGEHLGKGKGYRLRFPKNAFGVLSVNQVLRHCAAVVHENYRGTADILIGDISKPMGGHFPPHQSHQSGRDADVGYYLKGNIQNKTMYRVGGGDVDHAKNWTLLRCLLKEAPVVRVYMDQNIQLAMSRFLLEKKKLSSNLVERLFEVRSSKGARSLIRHAPLHDTHIHVRFACDDNDHMCVEEKGDSVFVLDGG